MTAIGVDFGTTNSVISYYDGGRPILYVPSASSNAPQVKSAVLISTSAAPPAIGLAAFMKRKRKGVHLIDRFKMRIGLADEAEVAAKTFLNNLLDNFRTDMGIKVFDSIVITVPDQWLRSEGQVSYQALMRICRDLRLPVRKILSEPVAAASYVAHRMKEQGEAFDGHALIYDHGGGTLDLSLVQIDGEDITTVDGAGVVPSQHKTGVGGASFDKAVLAAYVIKTPERTEMTQADEIEWLHEFENNKVTLASDVEDAISAFLETDRSDVFDDPIFDVRGDEICPSLLVEVFEADFASLIRSELERFIEKHSDLLSTANQNLRIVPVGGFSNFYLVRRLIEEVFERSGPKDIRFRTALGRADASYAVAYGACLFSANQTRVFESCPVDVSVLLEDEFGKPALTPLLRRGTPISEIGTAVFAPVSIVAPNRRGLRTVPIQLVFNQGDKERQIKTDFSAADALPDLHRAAEWRIGAFVDADLVAHIVFETNDRQLTRSVFSVGEIISNFGQGTIGDEPSN